MLFLCYLELNLECHMTGQILIYLLVDESLTYYSTTQLLAVSLSSQGLPRFTLLGPLHFITTLGLPEQSLDTSITSQFPNVHFSLGGDASFKENRSDPFPDPFSTFFISLNLGLWSLEKDLCVTIWLQIQYFLMSIFWNVWQSLQCLQCFI